MSHGYGAVSAGKLAGVRLNRFVESVTTADKARMRLIRLHLAIRTLHPTHYYIVDGNVNQLNKETNETHEQEAQTRRARNLGELCRKKEH